MALAQARLDVALVVPPAPDTVRVTLTGQANVLSGETAASTSVFAAEVPALKAARRVTGILARIETKGQVFERIAFAWPGADR